MSVRVAGFLHKKRRGNEKPLEHMRKEQESWQLEYPLCQWECPSCAQRQHDVSNFSNEKENG